MFIIWGSRNRERKINNGNFNCPDCGARRQYEHKQVKSWFTLYWIPIFPTGTLAEYIQCNTCSNAYDVGVLEYDPEKKKQEWNEKVAMLWRNTMISIAASFGKPNSDQAEIIHSELIKNWNITSRLQDVIDDSKNSPSNGIPQNELIQRITPLQDILDLKQKEDFLHISNKILEAGEGEYDLQTSLLSAIGNALGLSNAHIRGILVS